MTSEVLASKADLIHFISSKCNTWVSISDIGAFSQLKMAKKRGIWSGGLVKLLQEQPHMFEFKQEAKGIFIKNKSGIVELDQSKKVKVSQSKKSDVGQRKKSDVGKLKKSDAAQRKKSKADPVLETETMDPILSLKFKFTQERNQEYDDLELKTDLPSHVLIRNYLYGDLPSIQENPSNATLIEEEDLEEEISNQYGLLGTDEDGTPIFQNTSSPFCVVAVGIQGAGKSHSLATIIENCHLDLNPAIKAERPCSTLVFHYDSDQSNFCQSATLSMGQVIDGYRFPSVQRLIILVSPSFYYQRKAFYQQWPNCSVRPLLFRWKDMSASVIKSLMRVQLDKEPPLYMGALLDLLRKLQKKNTFPTFQSFKDHLKTLDLTPQQSGPLNLRLNLVESLLAESNENRDLPERAELVDICSSGSLVICDLTDPMMTAPEARGIFEVLLEKFKTISLDCGKMVVFDEAHKYLKGVTGGDELCQTIIELVRQMRHHGMRVVISSQSPMTIPDELMELVSVLIIHKFHSEDWFRKLRSKIPLDNNVFERILSLEVGSALVFCNKWSQSKLTGLGQGVRVIKIRNRVTADGGKSKSHLSLHTDII